MSIELVKSDIQKVLENEIVDRHSFFQLQHFVVNGEPTIQSRMWQCIRELKKRYDAIEFITLDIEETKDNIELLDLQVEILRIDEKNNSQRDDELSKIYLKQTQVKIRQLLRKKEASLKNLKKVEKTLQEQADEAKLFLKSFEAIQKIEPLKEFDDPQAQREYWNAKLARDINMSLLLGGLPLNIELVKTGLSMPDGSPIKQQLINIIEQLKVTSEAAKAKLQACETKQIEEKE